MPAVTGLGEPRQGTHLSMLRTTHIRGPEGVPGGDSPDYRGCSKVEKVVSPDYRMAGLV